jgi:hypothetical protein
MELKILHINVIHYMTCANCCGNFDFNKQKLNLSKTEAELKHVGVFIVQTSRVKLTIRASTAEHAFKFTVMSTVIGATVTEASTE